MQITKTAQEVLSSLDSSAEKGLTSRQIEERLKKYGPNELPDPPKESLIVKFINEFRSILVILLIIAAVISLALGENTDAVAILAIVLINGILGFVQEYKAEKAIEALKKLSTAYSKVVRNGEISKIEARNLVPGDIILLEAGDKVPADARIIEYASLEVSEAVLTGESIPVKKSDKKLDDENIPLGDRKNMLFKDTSIVYGRAKAVVVDTGVLTEVGRISKLINEETAPQTPLQIELEKVGKSLSFAAIGIIAFMFLLEIFFDRITVREAFLTSVSLAVAAIPEGLPAVITVVLAIGVSRLAKKNSIIRKLPAVETLGATTHILTDKT
ncbi:HAD-IC family P-type ATPase [candidate division WWE3 bacterium]|nr:HAD-IC family P-type ATPase [candidate division WWE3 bacterium]